MNNFTASPVLTPPQADEFRAAAEFVLMLRQHGIRDTAILRAMEHVPRVPFIERRWYAGADLDAALPIACGQTILKPSLIARMLEAARLQPSHKVLLVGAGSGYLCAVLSHLVAEIVAVERWRTLADSAHERLRALGYHTVEMVFADGLNGHATRAPYDRIIAAGAVSGTPFSLLEQMKADGLVIAPVAQSDGSCMLRRFSGRVSGQDIETLGAVQVQPLVSGVAQVY